MTNKTAAIRYARALFDVAIKEQADLEQIERELGAVRRPLHPASDAREGAAEPGRAGAAQARGGGRADWRALSSSPIVAKLLALLAERDRLVLLPDLLAVVPRAAAGSPAGRPRGSHDRGAARAERAQAIERGLAQLTGRTVTLVDARRSGDHRRRGRAHRQHGLRRQRHAAAGEDEAATGRER